jgi:outer membrane protein assembly factor BamB
MAFDQETGEVGWRSGDFTLSQASPVLIDVGGETQLVVSGGRDINGLDPATGRLLWSHPHDTDADMNISTPLWTPGNRLLVSSAYNGGSRLIQLTRRGTVTDASEVWFSPQLRLHFGTAARVDDIVLGSSGDFGPAFLTALDLETGRRLWQDRSFARAQLVQTGDLIVVLDEDGTLGLIRATRTGVEVLARADVLENLAWTPPTIVGGTLYARDREVIVKLELPAASGEGSGTSRD